MKTENVQPAGELGSFTRETPNSTSVSKIAWDNTTRVFSITFKSNGATYDYEGVKPADAWLALNSPSYGALTRNELKDYKGVKRA